MAYPISYQQLDEMMDERGVEVDFIPLNLWVLKYVPLLETQFCAQAFGRIQLAIGRDLCEGQGRHPEIPVKSGRRGRRRWTSY